MGIPVQQLAVVGSFALGGAAAFAATRLVSGTADGAPSASRLAITSGAATLLGSAAMLGARMLSGTGGGALTGLGMGLVAGAVVGGTQGMLALGRAHAAHGGAADPGPAPTQPSTIPGSANYTPRTGDLLPDITPVAPADIFLDRREGRTWLRFGTTYANIGMGPIEMVLGHGEGALPQQAIYNSDGSRRLVPVNGEFVYDNRPGMQHMHFDDFGRFELFRAGANGVAVEKIDEQYKVSFLITNTDNLMPRLDPNGMHQRTGYDQSATIQGMSVGWGDTYPAALDGQELDISGQPDGDYIVRMTFDPNHRFNELNRANNSYDTLITLVDGKIAKTVALGTPRTAPTTTTP